MNVMVNGESVKYDKLPEFCREIVRRYVEHGIDPGYGWMMILKNQLNAMLYCDDETTAAMKQILRWLHNDAPSRCHGSAERIQQWMIERRRASVKNVRSIGEQVADGLYKLREFDEDWDFYDPEIERWVWSVGKSKVTGEVFAALDTRFYWNDDYDLLWWR